MRLFYLNRKVDVSGCSGTGRVADGIEFNDGHVALRWNTDTASTEIWDSIDQVIQIHGHEGATELVFEEEAEPQTEYHEEEKNIHELGKSLAFLVPSYFLNVDFGITPIARLANDLIKSTYVSVDADNAGNKVALAESNDDEKEARRISNRINAGLGLFTEWVKQQGGYLIEAGGDEGLARVEKLDMRSLKKFSKEYEDLTGFTLTIGVGRKLSQATRARMLGKLKGKDRIELWSRNSKNELAELLVDEPKNEAEKIKDAGFEKAQPHSQPGSRGAQILGYTSSGKPIYASREDAKKRAREAQAKAPKKSPQAAQKRQEEKKAEAKGIRHAKTASPATFKPGSRQVPAGAPGGPKMPQMGGKKTLPEHLEGLSLNPGYVQAVLTEFLKRKLGKSRPVSQPGKRGGQVIGHDRMGNPIYASSIKQAEAKHGGRVLGVDPVGGHHVFHQPEHKEHKNLTVLSHQRAAQWHNYLAHKMPEGHAKREHHETSRNLHYSEAAKEAGKFSQERFKWYIKHGTLPPKKRPEGLNPQYEQDVLKEFLQEKHPKKAA